MAAALLLVIASTAGAASLGRLAVLSAIGEPLRAEINLLSSPDESSTLTPRLASPGFYPLAGFRYNPALAGARLDIRKHPHGRNVIEVVSARPVNEPFVHLLVELESNTTRIVRGYTLLLDPHGYGLPREAAATEFLPAAVPAAMPAVPSAAPRAPAPPRTGRAPVKAAAPAAAGDSIEIERQIRRLEEQLSEGAKTLAGMLDRVAAMELAVGQLQRRLETQGAAAAAPPARAPVAAKDAPAAAIVSPPRRARSWTESILNEALLVLVGGLVILMVGLGYVMWGRPPVKGESPARGE